MKMQQVRTLAKKRGINSFGKSKKNLILEIQRAEGNFDCFGSAIDYCDQDACCFRMLCLDGSTRPKGFIDRDEKLKGGYLSSPL